MFNDDDEDPYKKFHEAAREANKKAVTEYEEERIKKAAEILGVDPKKLSTAFLYGLECDERGTTSDAAEGVLQRIRLKNPNNPDDQENSSSGVSVPPAPNGPIKK